MPNTGKKYYVEEHLHRSPMHGGIGNVDIEKILKEEGFQPIRLPFHFNHSLFAKGWRFISFLIWMAKIPAGSVIAFQHPLYARLNFRLINKIGNQRQIKIICFVLDIDGLKDGNNELLQKEISFLKLFDLFIVHNESMRKWMVSQGITGVFAQLEFFSFLAVPFHGSRVRSNEIVFAGNLEKSRFIEELTSVRGVDSLAFNIYGSGRTAKITPAPNIHFKGVIPPYTLPASIEGSYGLVWDGDSIDGEGGSIGSYMQYITHHKISLYILAELPIIIYEGAGAAYLIEQYKIGITIHSLNELSSRLAGINDADYKEMVANCKALSEQIRNGSQTRKAIDFLLS
ncbi:MAG: hypothetical protein H7Y31_05960 [Chitinophagaceae bacterium]|nr:hypothetical protein [Chitinophagaceae bacterium]